VWALCGLSFSSNVFGFFGLKKEIGWLFGIGLVIYIVVLLSCPCRPTNRVSFIGSLCSHYSFHIFVLSMSMLRMHYSLFTSFTRVSLHYSLFTSFTRVSLHYYSLHSYSLHYYIVTVLLINRFAHIIILFVCRCTKCSRYVVLKHS
jgi:hypothetical protein